jgi:hypothetical protein
MVVKLRCVILKEDHTLRVFKDRILRRIFRLQRKEVGGDWKKLHNVELHQVFLG